METQVTQSKAPVIPAERFDGNQAEVYGIVKKIWSRSGGDVFARIVTLGEAGEEHPARVTIKFPQGKINGEDVSLMAEDALIVRGWISDGPYSESMVNFLSRAQKKGFLEAHPELQPLQHVEVKRAMTYVIPEKIELLSSGDETTQNLNRVLCEGIVARVWEFKGSKFVRLAVYDRYAVAQDETGRYGRPRRTPHYVTIQFKDGLVAGRPVTLLAKGNKDQNGIHVGDRIRVTGALSELFYKESLRTFLLNARQGEAISQMANADIVDEAWSSYSESCVVAEKLIHFTAPE